MIEEDGKMRRKTPKRKTRRPKPHRRPKVEGQDPVDLEQIGLREEVERAVLQCDQDEQQELRKHVEDAITKRDQDRYFLSMGWLEP
jgi:hypothetical protein